MIVYLVCLVWLGVCLGVRAYFSPSWFILPYAGLSLWFVKNSTWNDTAFFLLCLRTGALIYSGNTVLTVHVATWTLALLFCQYSYNPTCFLQVYVLTYITAPVLFNLSFCKLYYVQTTKPLQKTMLPDTSWSHNVAPKSAVSEMAGIANSQQSTSRSGNNCPLL